MTTTFLPPARSKTTPMNTSSGGSDQQPPAISCAKPTTSPLVAAQNSDGGYMPCDTYESSAAAGPILLNPLLKITAEVLDDTEQVRKANMNRLRQLTRTGVDKDGKHRGFALSETNPGVARLTALIEHQKNDEEVAVNNLRAELKAHPLYPWCKTTTGVGEKQLARLLGAIGDPYWNTAEDRARTVSDLWAYCGYHIVDGVAPRRRKGVQTDWNETARMRVWNITESCLKAKTSPYNPIYYTTRLKYEDTVHTHPCIQCGSRGRPAEPGTPLKPGHVHARALRKIGQVFLKDLWREARRLHEEAAAQ